MCICSVLGILLAVAVCAEPSARPDRRTVTLKPGDNFIDATAVRLAGVGNDRHHSGKGRLAACARFACVREIARADECSV